MTKPKITIDAETRRERERLGLSQVQLAVKAGVHPATVSLAERGASVSQSTAERIAGALGLKARGR